VPDNVEVISTPVAAAPAAVAPAAVAAPSPQPAATPATPVAGTTPTPAAAPAPVVETKPAATPADAPKTEPTVLGAEPVTAPVVDPAKPPVEAAKAPVEGEKTTPAQSAEPAPAAVYEKFTVPEGITLNDEQLGKFTGLLSEFETTTKADHAAVQAHGQKLMDIYIGEATRITNDLNKYYQDSWAKMKTDWRAEFVADPELGGNRQETTVAAAQTFIRTHGGSEAEQKEFRQLMESTGLGNHRVMIRILARAGVAMSEGRPLVATTPAAAAPKSKIESMYGTQPK